MKRLAMALLLGTPGLALAQQPAYDPSEMMRRMQDPEAMQQMAEQAEAAQKCMEGVDQSQLEALRRRGEETRQEIERLCAAGKQDEALAKGLAFSREVNSDPTLQKLRECSKDLSETMKGMLPAPVPATEEEPTEDDICS